MTGCGRKKDGDGGKRIMVIKSINIGGGEDRDPVAAALYRVLTGLGTRMSDGMYCWCQMRVGNSMATTHAPNCETARQVVATCRELEE